MRPLPVNWSDLAIGLALREETICAARFSVFLLPRWYLSAKLLKTNNKLITFSAMGKILRTGGFGGLLPGSGAEGSAVPHAGQTPSNIHDPHLGQIALLCMQSSMPDRVRKDKPNHAGGQSVRISPQRPTTGTRPLFITSLPRPAQSKTWRRRPCRSAGRWSAH